jgi:hypothetical protein
MRVDPFMQLNEAITSVFEAIAYPSMLVLAVMLLVVGALEVRSRIRRPVLKSNAGDRDTPRGRDTRGRSGRVAPAMR